MNPDYLGSQSSCSSEVQVHMVPQFSHHSLHPTCKFSGAVSLHLTQAPRTVKPVAKRGKGSGAGGRGQPPLPQCCSACVNGSACVNSGGLASPLEPPKGITTAVRSKRGKSFGAGPVQCQGDALTQSRLVDCGPGGLWWPLICARSYLLTGLLLLPHNLIRLDDYFIVPQFTDKETKA